MELIEFLARMPMLDILLSAALAALVGELLLQHSNRPNQLRFVALLVTILGLALWQFYPLWTAGMDNAEAGYFLIYASIRFGFGLLVLVAFWLACYFLIARRKAV